MRKMKDSNHSHIIRFNGQSVTCYDHSDKSVIALTKRYYEGNIILVVTY